MDPVKILKRSWYILWSYRALWVFGLILALAASGASRPSNNSNYQIDQGSDTASQLTPESLQQAFDDAQREMNTLLERGIPENNISGESLTTFLWVVGIFFLVMLIVGIVMAVARYVSETAVIRMVDEYETSGNKMTVREGFRIGWSITSWRLFLINLIVNLPVIAFIIVALFMGGSVFFSVINGNGDFAAFSVVSTLAILGLSFFVVLILTIVLHLLRNFFWRISVLEDTDVGESLQRRPDVACDDRVGNPLDDRICHPVHRRHPACTRNSRHRSGCGCPSVPIVCGHLQHLPQRLAPLGRSWDLHSAAFLPARFLTLGAGRKLEIGLHFNGLDVDLP